MTGRSTDVVMNFLWCLPKPLVYYFKLASGMQIWSIVVILVVIMYIVDGIWYLTTIDNMFGQAAIGIPTDSLGSS